ncbi:MAG TPA: FAD-dependent oxidoreductase [Micropepsaceae bacterium]|nr:FAD-dependent oxidoreductase [Micropepsaceae bacterium]
MKNQLGRRRVLSGAGAIMALSTLPRCAGNLVNIGPSEKLQVAPLDASTSRISAITVCTRPFRAQGPRLDVEQIAGKMVVHNYGHGGSGWSLSWGSAEIAAGKALADGTRDIAVIGCGALGMTTALTLQRAGARVTIYAKDLPPNVRSSFATGLFTPDSRICSEDGATPEFKQSWERMCRTSWRSYGTLLGLPGNPVEFVDNYEIAGAFSAEVAAGSAPKTRQLQSTGSALVTDVIEPIENQPDFAALQGELVPDLLPRGVSYAPGQHPFGKRYVRKTSNLVFNIAEYAGYLLAQFRTNGGEIVVREFHSPAEFAALPQTTLVNCTGYGARALLGDDSVIPVRGQLARMHPQPGVHYGIDYRSTLFLARRDSFVFQHFTGESQGFNDASTEPDRAEAELAVNTIGQLFAVA